ncbi:MAG: YfiR family protein [Candidatus Thiodiazotropha sp.]
MTRLLIHFTLALLCSIASSAYCDEQQSEENLVKAVFIYNFAKFTRWPADTWAMNEAVLRICAVGDDEMVGALAQLNGKKVREHPVIVEPKGVTNNLHTCHLIYLARSRHDLTQVTTDHINSKPILTVSEIKDFSKQGGMIELYTINGKVRFKINLQTTRDAGLDLSSRLLKLAAEVHR